MSLVLQVIWSVSICQSATTGWNAYSSRFESVYFMQSILPCQLHGRNKQNAHHAPLRIRLCLVAALLTNNVKPNAKINISRRKRGDQGHRIIQSCGNHNILPRDDNHKTMETPQVLAVFVQLADFCCIMVRQGLELLEVWLTSGFG